ncbi:MAG: hypothetical protein ACPL25_06160 [Ignavibacteria bacterium]
MRRILPKVFYNPVSLIGGSIAVVSFGLILFLMILELLSKDHKPYMGIIAFVILPAFLLIGIAVFFIGAIRENRRVKAGISKEFQFPVIDMNDPHQRRAVVFFSSAGILLLLFSAFGSYKAYEYTDSDAFCGELCHSVMSPEYTAYQVSHIQELVASNVILVLVLIGLFVQNFRELIRFMQLFLINIQVLFQPQ